MFSADDRRRLAAIERELASEDPDLARRLASGTPRHQPWEKTVPVALIVLGTIGILAGALTLDLAVFLVAGIAPVLAGLRLRRRPDGGTATRHDRRPPRIP